MKNEWDDQLDLYVDSMLEELPRHRFETEMLDDDRLRRAVAQQRSIDASLRRQLAPPPTLDLGAVVRAAAEPPPSPALSTRWRSWAIAASLLATFVGVWLGWEAIQSRRQAPGPYDRPWTTLTQLYDQTVETGFEPDWVCADDAEFAAHFRDSYGQPLLLAPGNVEALGLSIGYVMSPRTTCLLARVDGRDVLVAIDRVEVDGGAALDQTDGLNRFRRLLGRLVAYEITPLAEPRVLDSLYQPEQATP